MRRAHAHHAREFDIVVCTDNSLPHLLSDEEISTALGQFLLCTKPGGLVIISMHDYATLERGGTQIKPYAVRYDGTSRYVLFQIWDWRDSLYDLSFYIVHDDGVAKCRQRELQRNRRLDCSCRRRRRSPSMASCCNRSRTWCSAL
jgi:hypothetical protein